MILNAESKQAASLLAEQTFARYKNIFGHYRNTASSHLVGHLGEFAAFIWLRDNGFEPIPHFSDSQADRKCDIETKIGRLEVKTWSAQHWDRWGRAISVTQYPSISRKADFIFFCTADEVESETPKIQFRGWVEVHKVGTVEPKWTGNIGREVHNYQLEEHHLKGVETLKEML